MRWFDSTPANVGTSIELCVVGPSGPSTPVRLRTSDRGFAASAQLALRDMKLPQHRPGQLALRGFLDLSHELVLQVRFVKHRLDGPPKAPHSIAVIAKAQEGSVPSAALPRATGQLWTAVNAPGATLVGGRFAERLSRYTAMQWLWRNGATTATFA